MDKEQSPQRIDYGIILPVFLLSIIGILSIYSTTVLIQGDTITMTIMQIVWYGLGAIVAGIVMMFDSEQLWKLTTWLYWLSILLLVFTLLFYDENLLASSGARRWIRLPITGLTLQTSEFIKIPYILMLAKTVTIHNDEYEHRDNRSDLKLLLKLAFYSAIPIVLVLMQPDLGTAVVLGAITIGVSLLSGVNWKILFSIFMGISLLAILFIFLAIYNREFLINLGFHEYQFSRIDTWLNPGQDMSSSGYQIIQGMKAIGSGGVFGQGFGESQVYVPVRESDMLMATIGENFGFVGSSILVFVYFILIYNIIKVIYDTRNEFYTYIAVGVIMMIVFHVFQNIGMNIGLLPVTGIPLPFISQGGSALLGNMMAIGLILSMRFHHKSYYSRRKR